MQLICEAYHRLKSVAGLSNIEMHEVFCSRTEPPLNGTALWPNMRLRTHGYTRERANARHCRCRLAGFQEMEHRRA
jgi:hypothetical protein